MERKHLIMDEATITRALARMTHEIIEKNSGVDNVVILGVKNRGIDIANILASNIKKFEGVDVPFGSIDVTMHRDDYSLEMKKAKATESFIPCDLVDKVVIIVDDVLFTGRTARAALETVFSIARPRIVQYATLVDRGHREVPIRPDYVGKNIPTSRSEKVQVLLTSEEKSVYIIQQ